jgi:5-methylcytosine-specific restriction endonuclease McrA
MGGRNFCLYCGVKIEKAYDWTAEGNSAHTYLHLDHMDPISLGGEGSERNTVYCCVSCNLKKGDKLFTKWPGELKPKYRELSRRVYIEKHGKKPEEFEPSANEIVICIKGGKNV